MSALKIVKRTVRCVIYMAIFGVAIAMTYMLVVAFMSTPKRQAPYYIDMQNSWEWVHSYEEIDGCVIFEGGKACGNYVIKDYSAEYYGR